MHTEQVRCAASRKNDIKAYTKAHLHPFLSQATRYPFGFISVGYALRTHPWGMHGTHIADISVGYALLVHGTLHKYASFHEARRGFIVSRPKTMGIARSVDSSKSSMYPGNVSADQGL